MSTFSFLGVVAGLYQDVWRSILFKENPSPAAEQLTPAPMPSLTVPIIPAIRDESYPVARALLIREGWVPQTNHWAHGNTVEVRSGNGPFFWAKGYHELDYCSGTGYALCRFEFNDPAGNLLVVITAGEVINERDENVTVFRVYLNPQDEEGAYGEVLASEKVTSEEFEGALQEAREQYQKTMQHTNP
ncbi:MAG TPA: hypothetical protein VFQ39_10910 [Longimicrobium sp.]|nr:hypothetical protein [Longimicrobium sp.]